MDVRARAAKLEADVRRRNAREYVLSAIVALGCATLAVMGAGTVVLRIACGAGIVTAASISLRVQRAAWRASPVDENATDDVRRATLKAALVRQRDLLQTSWRWYVAPYAGTMALFLVSAWLELLVPGAIVATTFGLLATLSFVVGRVNRANGRTMQKDIDALEGAR